MVTPTDFAVVETKNLLVFRLKQVSHLPGMTLALNFASFTCGYSLFLVELSDPPAVSAGNISNQRCLNRTVTSQNNNSHRGIGAGRFRDVAMR